jgi:signal transduction histidine kinase
MRISRELHDQIGQEVSALLLGLKSLESSLPANLQATLQKLYEIAGHLGREAHQLALDLRPTALDDLGLASALGQYAENWAGQYQIGLDYQTNLSNTEPIPAQATTAAYRIAQEALTNVAKHAQARRVSLIVNRRSSDLTVIVEDDGLGFDTETVMNSQDSGHWLGILGMRERAEQVGGKLSIESVAGKGTAVYVRLPLNAQEEVELFE